MSTDIAWAFALIYVVSVMTMAYAVGRLAALAKSLHATMAGMAKKWSDHAMSMKAPNVVASEHDLERSRLAVLNRMQERGVSPEVMTQLWSQSQPTPEQRAAEFSGRESLDDDVG